MAEAAKIGRSLSPSQAPARLSPIEESYGGVKTMRVSIDRLRRREISG